MDRLLILATLIVTTTTIYGLVALWAATSQRRWYVRTSVVYIAIGLPLLIPAYELTVTYAVQAVTVAIGIQAYRRFRSWRSKNHDEEQQTSPSPAPLRFSLASLLWSTVFIAITAAVAVRLPTHEWQGWVFVTTVGLLAGVQALAAAYLARGGWPILIRLPISGLTTVAAFCAVIVTIDALSPSSTAGGITWNAFLTLFGYDVSYLFGDLQSLFVIDDPGRVECLNITLANTTVMALLLFLCGAANPGQKTTHGSQPRPSRAIRRRLAAATLVVLMFVIAVPPVGVFIWMLNPTPIPEVALPEPNGYHDLVTAGRRLSTPTFNNWDTSTIKQLRAEVARHEQDFDRLAQGLSRECQKPLDFSDANLSLPEIQSLRSAARALSGRARVARYEGRYEDASHDYLSTVRLGAATERGGLMVDSLVGIAIRGIGLTNLAELRTELSTEQCRDAARTLHEARRSLEPLEEFIRRDHIWMQHAEGWQGRLTLVLDILSNDPGWAYNAFHDAHRRSQTQMQLLITDLALRVYQFENSTLPESLAALVPDYLPELPSDPYGGGPLMYQQTIDGYLLYSVGPNGKDDHGQLPEDEDAYYVASVDRPGDITLDMFAYDPSDENATADENTTADENGTMDGTSTGDENASLESSGIEFSNQPTTASEH